MFYCTTKSQRYWIQIWRLKVVEEHWFSCSLNWFEKKMASMDFWHEAGRIHAVGAKFWPYHLCAFTDIEIHQNSFSSLQLSRFGELVDTAAADFCSWLTEVKANLFFYCRSPFVLGFNMLFILKCFLFTTTIQSDYMSYFILSVGLNQSGHSLLMFYQQGISVHRTAAH